MVVRGTDNADSTKICIWQIKYFIIIHLKRLHVLNCCSFCWTLGFCTCAHITARLDSFLAVSVKWPHNSGSEGCFFHLANAPQVCFQRTCTPSVLAQAFFNSPYVHKESRGCPESLQGGRAQKHQLHRWLAAANKLPSASAKAFADPPLPQPRN